MDTPFNINEYVRVKLTEAGGRHYREYFESLLRQFPEELRDYKRQKIYGLDGNSLQIQLWELMHIFGPKIYMSADQMFEDNLIFLHWGAD